MKITSLQDLYINELRDLLSAENQIIKALPKMARKATSPELANAFTEHQEQTEEHAARLEQILDSLDASVGRKKCKGIEGLLREGSEFLDDDIEEHVRDAALIAAAQKVEHYEIAGYGCARTFANLLGRENDASLLQQTLDEEGATDKKLTQLAQSMVNMEAAHAAS